MKIHLPFLAFLLCIMTGIPAGAQMITGYWTGKIDRKNVELKIIKNGDSLTGTSYYYQSPNNYSRYTIKGYFNSNDNSVVWWDDLLIEEKGKRAAPSKKAAHYLSTADFNCPGGSKMYLDGRAGLKDEDQNRPVALEKKDTHIFIDEWDYVIDNYTVGANDPELIDSISNLAYTRSTPAEPTITITQAPAPTPTAAKNTPKKDISIPVSKKEPPVKHVPEPVKEPVAVAPLTNEEKFTRRSRKLMQEITISGDSVELHFYDNAEIDGDSIAIFLNNKLLYEHVRLTDKPYTIKLAVTGLQPTNELVMVAENLGSIPPNTSLMVAEIDGKRYEARLESTEYSSAVIRFVKK